MGHLMGFDGPGQLGGQVGVVLGARVVHVDQDSAAGVRLVQRIVGVRIRHVRAPDVHAPAERARASFFFVGGDHPALFARPRGDHAWKGERESLHFEKHNFIVHWCLLQLVVISHLNFGLPVGKNNSPSPSEAKQGFHLDQMYPGGSSQHSIDVHT